MKKLRLLPLAICGVLALLLSSCHTEEKIVYMQDIDSIGAQAIREVKKIKVQPEDQISILVTCRDKQLSELFNLVRAQQNVGSTSSNGVSGYTIDSDGNIDFPVVGTLHVAGMTKDEIAKMIKNKLESQNLAKDPVVTVEFMNLYFSAMGEVKNPGKYNITKDKITLLEALSMAGDLTITGRRDKVYVVREENGMRNTYHVDLRKSDFFSSPVYYLRQNDIIYVTPNRMRAGQSTINDNSLQSVSLWISIGSFLTSLAVLIFK